MRSDAGRFLRISQCTKWMENTRLIASWLPRKTDVNGNKKYNVLYCNIVAHSRNVCISSPFLTACQHFTGRERLYCDLISPPRIETYVGLNIKFHLLFFPYFIQIFIFSAVYIEVSIIPYPTTFPYGNGMVLHFYQQQESSTTKTVHKVINKGLKAYV